MAASFKILLSDTRLSEMILALFALRITGEIERLKAETELRESHNQFLTVLDGIDASIYVGDIRICDTSAIPPITVFAQ